MPTVPYGSVIIKQLILFHPSDQVCESAAMPGVTRMLKWVRLGGELDLLDAPGVIPASFNDQVGDGGAEGFQTG